MRQSRKDNHNWSREDNLIALYYYRFGTKFLEMDEKQIANEIGTTVASLKMQSKNFEMLDTGRSGLSDYSEIQSEVYRQFGKVARYGLFVEVKKALDLDTIMRNRIMKAKSLNGFRRLTPVAQ
jgi:hypothetical protein